MLELMVYAGHYDCYGKCEEVLKKFTSLEISPSQIFRVTNNVSEELKSEDHNSERILQPVSNKDYLYIEVDGSMIHTRKNEEPWKEVKLGRIFRGEDCMNPNTDASHLEQSHYVGHFGKSADFCVKMDKVIDSYGDLKDRMVFLSDGAPWIREWISDRYPFAVSILDFYHAMGYFYEFADKAFPNSPAEKQQWVDCQQALLLESNVDTVLDNIKLTQAKEEDRKKLITYCQNNKKRMQYGQYRKIGCGIIGSGAIESSHRTVIQKRMQLAGQRWSIKGAKNMLRLRIISMNNQWAKVINAVKMPTLARSA